MTNYTEHAIFLAENDYYVFPVQKNKLPYSGFLWKERASNDPAVVAEMFAEYPDSLPAVLPDRSGKSVIDIDQHKDAASGFDTATENGLPTSSMVKGTSVSGKGTHLWFHGVTRSVNGIYPAIDRKSRGGYVIVTYDLPNPDDIFERLPKGYAIKNEDTSGGYAFEGDIEDWLSMLPAGEPADSVKRIMGDVPPSWSEGKAEYDEMLRLQYRLVSEGALGRTGVGEALKYLYDAWTFGKYDGDKYKSQWANALIGAIKKNGGARPVDDVHNFFSEKGAFLAMDFAKANSGDLAKDASGALWVYENGVYKLNDNIITTRLTKTLENAYKTTYKQPVEDFVRHGMELPELDGKPNTLINLKNCMYDYKTGDVFAHSPSFLSTVQLGFEYDPNATSPKFDAWLEQVAPHSVDMMWEVIGYSLMSGNPFQKAVLLVGSGRNGKSTFLRVIQNMMGEENYSSLTLKTLTEGKFEVASLYGKLANIAGDIYQPHAKDSETIKQVTGGDHITAQRKYGNPFTFSPWATLFFSTNKMWSSSDTSRGYIRRWLPLAFDQLLPEDSTFNEEDLYAEAAGIFNKAMVALQRLMERGQFEPSHRANELALEFVEASDKVVQWLNDSDFVTVADPTHHLIRTPRSDVYKNYQAYGGKMGRDNFYADLKDKGYIFKEGGTRDILGIKVRDITAWGEVSNYSVNEVNF